MKAKLIERGSKKELKLQLADFILNTATKVGRYQGKTIYSLENTFVNGVAFNQIEFDKLVSKIMD